MKTLTVPVLSLAWATTLVATTLGAQTRAVPTVATTTNANAAATATAPVAMPGTPRVVTYT
jgi:hypothetical protein